MSGNLRCNTHNERAKIAESYNALYSYFSSDEIKQVGNYSIVKLIGEGAFGKVYLANHVLTHTKVVLKTGAKDDPNIVREVFYHRQFKHPNITRLYEVVVSDGKIWMVLEYCPGRELYDYVLGVGRVDLDEAKKFFTQISSAVYYAHSLNCIHRDLKLENILLDKKRNIKLSDFGFTREYESRTLLETICGTTVYMAPELLEKKKYNGFKVDIWSLGIILYTLLYGEMPFEEEDDLKTQVKIINDEPVYKNDIPVEAISLIQSLLKKNPNDRPSIKEVLSHPFIESLGSGQIDLGNNLIKKLSSNKSFDSKIDKYLLKKLKSIGIDTNSLKKSVLSNNCDSLSGLWELLLEKQKRSELKKYKTRSRSVLRITESTSRRVSQFMENSPSISRIVSQRSVNTTANSNSTIPKAATYANSVANSISQSISPKVEKRPSTDSYLNHNSVTSSPEKKKNNFISKISKLWKRKDNHDQLYTINSRDSFGSRQVSPNKLNTYTPPHPNNNRRISFNRTTFQNRKYSSNDHVKEKEEVDPNESLPNSIMGKNSSSSLQRSSKPSALDLNQNSSSSPILEQISQHQEQYVNHLQQPALTIKDPTSPTFFVNGGTGSRTSSLRKQRPTSILSQHSLMSQFTTKSDASLGSNTTTRSDSRPPFSRRLSSDDAKNSGAKRSLSLISSNSSTSERSSRRSSLYENSPSAGRSTITEFRLKNTMAPTRGRRPYTETSIFPKHFRRRKSPLGSALLSGGSKFKRSKTLIIEEEEGDDDTKDEELSYDEDIDGLETDLENLGIVESTRKSSDFESDLNEERGRQLERD